MWSIMTPFYVRANGGEMIGIKLIIWRIFFPLKSTRAWVYAIRNPSKVPRKATESPIFMVFQRICRVTSSDSAFLTMTEPVGWVEKTRMLMSGKTIKKKMIATTRTNAILVKISYLEPDFLSATKQTYLLKHICEILARGPRSPREPLLIDFFLLRWGSKRYFFIKASF